VPPAEILAADRYVQKHVDADEVRSPKKLG
jgi:hypothetical protein